MTALETLFQGMLHSMTFNEVVSASYSFSDNLNIHIASTPNYSADRVGKACPSPYLATIA